MIVHSFNMGDVEDPEIYAAVPLHDWQQTEQGKWVMEHAIKKPMLFIRTGDYYGYKIVIEAKFNQEDEVWYNLKFK